MPSKRLVALTRDGGEQPILQYSPMCSVWAFTAYDACDLRCSYCASYAQGPSRPLATSDQVRDLLHRQLEAVPADDLISIGPIIDGYTRAEADHEVTRAALEVLVADGRDLVIVTKGPTVLRDLDLLRGYDKVKVNVSLPSFDEAALARIEPHAPTAAERRGMIETLHAAGVAAQLHVQPWIPGLCDAAEMIAWADERFPTWFAPLNIQNPVVARGGWGKRFTQLEINEAYVAEMRRIGPRPKVSWARPVWLGDDLLAMSQWGAPTGECHLDPPPELRSPAPIALRTADAPDPAAVAQRDVEATLRILDAMARDRLAMIGMEVLSAHVRCYAGRYPDREVASEGPTMARFWALQGALADRDITVQEAVADGPVVHARFTMSGTLTMPVEGNEPGALVAVDLVATCRYDDHGLLIEQWQEIEAIRRLDDVSASDDPRRQAVPVDR
jgi:hypothetical protein